MGKPRQYSDEYMAGIVDRYNKGESSHALWKELGHSPGTILEWVRLLGFEVRTFKASRNVTQEKKFLSKDGKQKLCSDCGLYKDIETQFRPNPSATGGVYSRCNDCQSKLKREEYAADPEPHKEKQRRLRKERPEVFRGYELKKRFKITVEEHQKLFESQNRKCAGCGSSDSGEPSGIWHTDHDSSCCPTGSRTCGQCIRGILCRWCNLTLGNAKDDVERMRGLIQYLEKYNLKKSV
jgi:hypothetical protein